MPSSTGAPPLPVDAELVPEGSPPPTLVELELPPPVPPVPPLPPMQSPFAQVCPVGQTTPAQGSLPQAPVTGSHKDPSGHVGEVHLFVTQTAGFFEKSQTSPITQAGLQSETHSPFLQTSPVLHVLPAQLSTHSVVPPLFGLHT